MILGISVGCIMGIKYDIKQDRGVTVLREVFKYLVGSEKANGII